MLDVFLVVAGVGCIIISYMITDRMDKNGNKKDIEVAKLDLWTEKDELRIRQRIEDIVLERADEAVIKTDDQLAQITNEKIMAISDFSEQILENIEKNHKEVIFLYDMLNTKDEQLKQMLGDIHAENNKLETLRHAISEELKEAVKQKERRTVSEKPVTQKAEKENKRATLPEKKKKEDYPSQNRIKMGEKEISFLYEGNEVQTNKNSQILKLYEEGSSIVEIAKVLGLGQGEVKLVIDLFKGSKR
ncbi:MAG: hypothetical protein PWP24_1073 [Clostridiales bacterium]|nr:hypothetical protein [Clostridiales bacterium]